MKKIYKLVLLALLLVECAWVARAQDPNFSQFYFKESFYNPAFTGIVPGLRGSLSSRQMWTGVPGSNRSTDFSIEFYDVQLLNGGLGAFVTDVTRGDNNLRTTDFGIRYGKRITLGANFIMQLGIQGSYYMKRVDFSGLVFTDQLDAILGRVYETQFRPEPGLAKASFADFSAGWIGRFNINKSPSNTLMTTTLGFALHHLTQPNESTIGGNAPLPVKLNAHIYTLIKVAGNSFKNNAIFVAPGLIFENQNESSKLMSISESGAQTLSFGLNGILPLQNRGFSLYAGGWMRKQFTKNVKTNIDGTTFDSFIMTLGMSKYSRTMASKRPRVYRLAYSYDLTISNAGVGTGGTHEVVLVVDIQDLELPGKKRKWGYVKHPSEKFLQMK